MAFLLSFFLRLQGGKNGFRKLIRTRGALNTALISAKQLRYFPRLLAVHKLRDRLEVTVAATLKFHITYNAVIDIKGNPARTDPFWSIIKSHINLPCRRRRPKNRLNRFYRYEKFPCFARRLAQKPFFQKGFLKLPKNFS